MTVTCADELVGFAFDAEFSDATNALLGERLEAARRGTAIPVEEFLASWEASYPRA